MQRYITCIALFGMLFFIGINGYSQKLQSTIQQVSNEIARKTSKKHRTRLAVADFVNNAKADDPITRYVTDQVETYLINSDSELSVVDRRHIKQLLAEHHLQSEGLIDESTARSSISFIKVDGWVIGEVTSFEDQIKITIKVIDVSTSEIFAATSSEPVSDPAIKKLVESTAAQDDAANKDCIRKSTGDFCFERTGGHIIVNVAIYSQNKLLQKVAIPPKEKQCFMDLPIGTYTYVVQPASTPYFVEDQAEVAELSGQVKVEKCKSKLLQLLH